MVAADRNYLTFQRYVGLQAERVAELGGDPKLIPPSATGTWPNGPGVPPISPDRGCERPDVDEFWGKIELAIFDHFGDFDGFVLETETGRCITFSSREEGIRDIVLRAITARIRVSVVSECKDPRDVRRILLHMTPGLSVERWW